MDTNAQVKSSQLLRWWTVRRSVRKSCCCCCCCCCMCTTHSTAPECACGLCLRHVNLERSPHKHAHCTATAPQLHLCTFLHLHSSQSKYPHQLPTPQPAATQCLQQHDTGYGGPCQEGAPRQEAQSAGRRTEKWAGSSNLLSTPSCAAVPTLVVPHPLSTRPAALVWPCSALLCFFSLPLCVCGCNCFCAALNQGPLTRYLLSFQMTSLALGPSLAPPVVIRGNKIKNYASSSRCGDLGDQAATCLGGSTTAPHHTTPSQHHHHHHQQKGSKPKSLLCTVHPHSWSQSTY